MNTAIKKGCGGKQMYPNAGHFDGHADISKRYGAHRPMKHDQGYTGSHWTPPSGNYSLRIAPAAAMATANKPTT